MALNHNKMSFPWKLFCFFKSKTQPLRLWRNTTQRLRQGGEPGPPFCPSLGLSLCLFTPGGMGQGHIESGWHATPSTVAQSPEKHVTF